MPAPVPRTCADSRSSVVRLMLPTDANFAGNVFGGVLLEEVDRVAYVTASRHAKSNCVTASLDRVDFIAPVHVGEVVEFDATLTSVGKSSMEVWVRIRAEALEGGSSNLVAQAYVTMVAVDREGRPAPVPPLEPTDDDERTRAAEGRARMELRRSSRSR